MESINIRSLKNDTSRVLERISLGESLELRRRNKPIAVIKPIDEKIRQARPNFLRRLESIYGQTVLTETATEIIQEERGGR